MGSGKLISDIPAAKKWHISKILSVFYRPRRDMQRRRYLNVYLFIVVDTHLSVCLLTERWVYQVFFSVFDLAESESERSIRRPLLFWVHVIFFHSLPSRAGYSFQGKLFSIPRVWSVSYWTLSTVITYVVYMYFHCCAVILSSCECSQNAELTGTGAVC